MGGMTIPSRVAAGTTNGGKFTGKTHAHDRIELMPENPGPKRLARLSLQGYNRSVEHVISRRERFDLTPPYQRGSVWGVERRQNLVKSLLMGLPIGTITLNDRGYREDGKDMGVVDGKQRMEAIWAFVDSEFAIPAAWLDPKEVIDTVSINYQGQTVDGVSYSGASTPFRRGFTNLPIQMLEAEVVGLGAEAEVFLLINTGGVEQTEQSIANAEEFRAAVAAARGAGYAAGHQDAAEEATGLDA